MLLVESKEFIFTDLPVKMNSFDSTNSIPNYWLSCLLIDKEAMCKQERTDQEYKYVKEHAKTCPSEILEVLAKHNIEGRPIWKPMHLQPIFKGNKFIYVNDKPVNEDIFERGLCLPSDNKMSTSEINTIISIIHECFK